MRITNKYGLPDTLVNVAERDDYTKGDARISITGLLTPPRMAALRRLHHDKIESDISENIWPLMGRAIHKVLEMGADEEHVSEERLYVEVDGWRVSGGVDLQKLGGNSVRVVDYKFTSAYSVLNDKPDWVAQLNCYAELIRQAKNYEVSDLAICAIIRDWSRHRAKEQDYPQTPIVMVPIELWPSEKAKAFISERVHMHREAIVRHDLGEELPPCTDEDRWMRGASWAVRKINNKRATRVFDAETDAIAFAQTDPKFVVEHRPAQPIRCMDYCHVAPWCAQFAAWKGENQ